MPGVPTGVAAFNFGPNGVVVNWTAPADGGSPITAYVVTPFLAGVAQPSITQAASVGTTYTTANLAAGTYTFKVAARNTKGTGPASPASAPLVHGGTAPPQAPGAPSNVTAVQFGNTAAAVTWPSPPRRSRSAPTPPKSSLA